MPSSTITIVEKPERFQPIFNPITVTVTSTSTAQCNFRYRLDLYVRLRDGSTESLATSLRLFPELDGSATFKVNRVLEDWIDTTLSEPTYNLTSGVLLQDSFIVYRMEIKEEYDTSGDCTGEATVQSTVDVLWDDEDPTSVSFAAFAGALDQRRWVEERATGFYDGSGNLYRMDGGGRFLSDHPTTTPATAVAEVRRTSVPVRLDERHVLCFLYDEDLPIVINKLTVVTYNAGGTQIASTDLAITMPTSPWGYGVYAVGVGPDNLRGWCSANTIAPIIDSSVAYYTVQLKTGASENSERVRFDVDMSQVRWKRSRIFWLNRLGGWDAISMDTQVARTSDRTIWNKLVGGGGVSGYSMTRSERGASVSQVTAKNSVTLRSGLLSEKVHEWAHTLVTSPQVYVCENQISFTMTYALTASSKLAVKLQDCDLTPGSFIADEVWHLDDGTVLSGFKDVFQYLFTSQTVIFDQAGVTAGARVGCLYGTRSLYPTPVVIEKATWTEPREKIIRLEIEAAQPESNVQRG